MDDEDPFKLTERFFKNDYNDRGMVKWQGFYLSDHTEDVAKHEQSAANLRNQKEMPPLDMATISEILFHAYTESKPILYQLKGKSELGVYAPIERGLVNGYLDNEIAIGNARILIDDLQWCELT